MESPLVKLCKKLKISVSDLAVAAGISSSGLSAASKGRAPINSKVLALLKEMGEDIDKLMEEHEKFRLYVQKEMRDRLLGKIKK